jgi:hypothetical protein
MYLKGAPIGLALALPSNSKTRLERVSKVKCSSLLGLVVSDKGKKVYTIDTRSKSLFVAADKTEAEAEAAQIATNKIKTGFIWFGNNFICQ